MTFRNLVFLSGLLVMVLGMQSCDTKTANEKESGELIKIIHSSGDDYSYKSGEEEKFYAPYPFNQGVLTGSSGDKYDVVLLSKKIEQGKEVGIEVFAKMTIVDLKGKETDILVARPTNNRYVLCPIKDFYDFSIEQFYFKQMVQYWYSNRFGLNGTIVKGWEPVNTDAFKK